MANTGADPEPRRHLLVYALAGVTYIGAGILEKGILNWVMGPLWLLLVMAVALRLMPSNRPSSTASAASGPDQPTLSDDAPAGSMRRAP